MFLSFFPQCFSFTFFFSSSCRQRYSCCSCCCIVVCLKTIIIKVINTLATYFTTFFIAKWPAALLECNSRSSSNISRNSSSCWWAQLQSLPYKVWVSYTLADPDKLLLMKLWMLWWRPFSWLTTFFQPTLKCYFFALITYIDTVVGGRSTLFGLSFCWIAFLPTKLTKMVTCRLLPVKLLVKIFHDIYLSIVTHHCKKFTTLKYSPLWLIYHCICPNNFMTWCNFSTIK